MVTFTEGRVFLRGEDRGVHDVQVEAAIGSDLPDRLAAGGAVTRRTGAIRWRHEGVTGWANPFDPDAPHVGDPVVIQTRTQPTGGRLGEWATIFTGQVDTREGDLGKDWETPVVDAWDDFSRTVRVEPLLRFMPGRRDSTLTPISPGTSALFVVHDVLRQCGYSTGLAGVDARSDDPDCFYYAPLQGSTWSAWRDSQGANARAGRAANKLGEAVRFVTYPTTGETYLTEGYAKYDKDPKPRVGNEDPVTFGFALGDGHTATVDIVFDVGVNQLKVTVDGSRQVRTYLNNTLLPVSAGKSRTLPKNAGRVLVTFQNRGTWGVTAWRRDGSPLNVDTEGTHTYSAASWGVVGDMEITARSGSMISHVSVGVGLRPAKRAQVSLPTNTLGYLYTPSVRDRQAGEVLEEIAAALCCPIWFDAEGVLHMEHAETLRQARETMTIPITDAKTAPSVEDVQMTAREIRVTSKAPVYTRSKNAGASVTLWQGGGSIAAGEVVEEWVGPGEDEDWLEIDKTFAGRQVTVGNTNTADHRAINAMTTSVYLTEMAGNAPGDWSFRFEEVTPWRFKATMESLGNPIRLQIPTGGGHGFIVPVQGDETPILRGGAIVRQEDNKPVIVSVRNASGGALEHDAGIWGQGSLAREIAEMTAKYAGPDYAIYFRDLELLYDPSLDVGRTVVLDFTEPWGVKVKALITGVVYAPAEGVMTIQPRIIRVDRTGAPTWDQVEAHVTRRRLTWDAHETTRRATSTTWGEDGAKWAETVQ